MNVLDFPPDDRVMRCAVKARYAMQDLHIGCHLREREAGSGLIDSGKVQRRHAWTIRADHARRFHAHVPVGKRRGCSRPTPWRRGRRV